METSSKTNFGNEVISLIDQPELKDTVYDILELALDSSLHDGLLKDIPFVGTVMNICNAALTIKDRLLMQKVAHFLLSLQDISDERRKEFVDGLERDDQRRTVGEKLILILDRQDDLEKAELIGEVFRHYVVKKIEKDVFEMLCHSITLSFPNVLDELWEYKEGFGSQDLSRARALTNSGLAEILVTMPETTDDIAPGRTGVSYKLSSLGKTLADILKERHERNSA